MTLRKTLLITSLAAALAALGAACGGDDDASGVGDTGVATPGVPAGSETGGAGGAVTTLPTESSPTTTPSPGTTAPAETGSAAGGAETGAALPPLTVQLEEQDDSGESGTATLTDLGNGKTRVALILTGGGTDPQPAHIHTGTCDDVRDVVYPLEDVTSGAGASGSDTGTSTDAAASGSPVGGATSETEVDATLAELTGSEYVINVHRSAAEAETYVACGVISDTGDTGATGGDTTDDAMSTTGTTLPSSTGGSDDAETDGAVDTP